MIEASANRESAPRRSPWPGLLRHQQRLRSAVFLLTAAAAMVLAAWWIQRLSRAQAALPAKLEMSRQTLGKMGGQAGLESRRASLLAIREDLARTEKAVSSDAAALGHRIERVCSEQSLTVTAASDWQPIPELAVDDAVAFRRLYQGSGPAMGLWTALHTFESWPDQVRIRALEVGAGESGGVLFAVELAVFRRQRGSEKSATGEAAGGGTG